MVFSSAVFLWIFLPFVFVGNLCLRGICSNAFLLAASLFFYAWGEPCLVFLMIGSIVVNWLAGRGITRYARYRKAILTLAILCNLLVLGYFKYAGFLIGGLNTLAGRQLLAIPRVRLPIGISFFTFQAISYVVDVYRGETAAQDRLLNTALYISFFPQLIAGPIVKYKEISRQLEHRQITADHVAEGFRRFVYGLSKKVLISNILGAVADYVFGLDVTTIGGAMAWTASICYMFQIYYDFSGYSDMAIGLGAMFGFTFQENFRYPYLSTSIREFWRRWHISLSTWFKEYVYIPLGGNRKGTIRTYVNLLTVFFLTGLWHGAGLNYILWGLYHGFFSIVERLELDRFLNRHRWVARGYTLLAVNIGWILFRLSNLRDILRFLKRMLVPWHYSSYDIPLWEYADSRTLLTLFCAAFGMGILQKLVPEQVRSRWKFSVPELTVCAALLLLCLSAIAGDTYNPFIYFNF